MYIYVLKIFYPFFCFNTFFISSGSCGSYQSKTNEITKENLTDKDEYIYRENVYVYIHI